MKILVKATVVAFALSFAVLHAGDAHNHTHDEHRHDSHGHIHKYDALKNEISKESVEIIAKKEVMRLALEKKIPKSWKTMPISKIGKTHYGDTTDWKVGFSNVKIKDKTKQTLYIFVSVHGRVTGANYTGN